MKHLIFITISFFLIGSCSPTTKQNETSNEKVSERFQILGKTELQLEEVFLVKVEEGQYVQIDSSLIVNGQFKFEGIVHAPQMYYLEISEEMIPLFIENSDIKIKASGSSADSVLIEGSHVHDEWLLIQNDITQFDHVLDSIADLYYNARDNNLAEAMIKYEAEYDSIENKKFILIDEYIDQNTNSFVSPYLVVKYRLFTDNSEELSVLVDKFDSSIKVSPYLEIVEERITKLELTKIGNRIPSFSLPNTNNEIVSIEDFRGQYVLIDFWASWCGPCRKENPNVVEAFNNYKDKGFTVLGVSLDNDRRAWLKAIEKDQLNWTNLSDLQGWDNEVATEFGVRSILFSILIDPEGIILAKNLRGDDLRAELKKHLTE